MNEKIYKKILFGGVIATLSFLPGCIPGSSGSGEQAQVENKAAQQESNEQLTGKVLATMNGVTVVTSDSLAKEKEKILKDPQVRGLIAGMSPQDLAALDRNILDGLVAQKVVGEYIDAHDIDETAQYKADLKDLRDGIARMLNEKYFLERLSIAVPESEVKSYYETNKDKMQGVVISRGGVAATGLEFADGTVAHAFVAQVKTSPGGFKKVAQDDGLTAKIRDFKLVNNQSIGIDAQLRDKIAVIKNVPSVEIFEVNGVFWVVNATAKEEPKYMPYEQIKDFLRQQLEQNKRLELFAKEIESLKKEYGVEINEDYFQDQQMAQAQSRGSAMASMSAPEKQEMVEKRLA